MENKFDYGDDAHRDDVPHELAEAIDKAFDARHPGHKIVYGGDIPEDHPIREKLEAIKEALSRGEIPEGVHCIEMEMGENGELLGLKDVPIEEAASDLKTLRPIAEALLRRQIEPEPVKETLGVFRRLIRRLRHRRSL